MIDLNDIKSRYQQAEPFLNERGRRLFAANEALAHGYGGVTAAAVATDRHLASTMLGADLPEEWPASDVLGLLRRQADAPSGSERYGAVCGCRRMSARMGNFARSCSTSCCRRSRR